MHVIKWVLERLEKKKRKMKKEKIYNASLLANLLELFFFSLCPVNIYVGDSFAEETGIVASFWGAWYEWKRLIQALQIWTSSTHFSIPHCFSNLLRIFWSSFRRWNCGRYRFFKLHLLPARCKFLQNTTVEKKSLGLGYDMEVFFFFFYYGGEISSMENLVGGTKFRVMMWKAV